MCKRHYITLSNRHGFFQIQKLHFELFIMSEIYAQQFGDFFFANNISHITTEYQLKRRERIRNFISENHQNIEIFES